MDSIDQFNLVQVDAQEASDNGTRKQRLAAVAKQTLGINDMTTPSTPVDDKQLQQQPLYSHASWTNRR